MDEKIPSSGVFELAFTFVSHSATSQNALTKFVAVGYMLFFNNHFFTQKLKLRIFFSFKPAKNIIEIAKLFAC